MKPGGKKKDRLRSLWWRFSRHALKTQTPTLLLDLTKEFVPSDEIYHFPLSLPLVQELLLICPNFVHDESIFGDYFMKFEFDFETHKTCLKWIYHNLSLFPHFVFRAIFLAAFGSFQTEVVIFFSNELNIPLPPPLDIMGAIRIHSLEEVEKHGKCLTEFFSALSPEKALTFRVSASDIADMRYSPRPKPSRFGIRGV